MFLVPSLPAFGYLNALTGRVWNRFCKKQTFAGSFSMRTVYYLERRGRVARFMHPAIRRLGRPLLRATAIQAVRFGAHRGVTRAILPTGSFIATPDSIFRWNTWDQLVTAFGSFPASNIIALPGPMMRRNYTIQLSRRKWPRSKPFIFLRNAGVRFVKLRLQGSIPLWWFPSTPSFSDTGGSKAPVSLNNSFAGQQPSAIFVSPRRANIWRRIPRSKLLSLRPQHGARTV